MTAKPLVSHLVEPPAKSSPEPSPASPTRLIGLSPLSPKLIDGFERIGAAAQGSFGPASFRSLARANLPLFDELQHQGASWKQIGLLLAERGVTAADGQPIAEAVLRATVSAARKGAGARGPDGAVRAGGSESDEVQQSMTQHSETRRNATQPGSTQLDATPPNATQRDEALRREARQNETNSNEAKQSSSHRSRRLPPIMDDNLLRRAERIQLFKEDT